MVLIQETCPSCHRGNYSLSRCFCLDFTNHFELLLRDAVSPRYAAVNKAMPSPSAFQRLKPCSCNRKQPFRPHFLVWDCIEISAKFLLKMCPTPIDDGRRRPRDPRGSLAGVVANSRCSQECRGFWELLQWTLMLSVFARNRLHPEVENVSFSEKWLGAPTKP